MHLIRLIYFEALNVSLSAPHTCTLSSIKTAEGCADLSASHCGLTSEAFAIAQLASRRLEGLGVLDQSVAFHLVS